MTFTAECEWDGYNWVATVNDLPGAVTQAKRLELIPPRLAEVVRLMTGKRVSPKDVTVEAHLPGKVDAEAKEIRHLRDELDSLQESLSKRQPRIIRALRREGLTVRDIGTIVGVSHQRVQQVLKGAS